MNTARLLPWMVFFGLGCASRGGYAEPGPMFPNASPPSPASIQSGGVFQPSPASGTPGETPPTVNLGGAAVPETHGRHGQAQTPATECATDADCVAATCCHATACVPAARAPACGETACSSECAPSSLDCGQGSCACVAGRCGVIRSRSR